MPTDVVVLGSGYAGAGAIRSLESELGDDVNLTWISDVDHHLVLHEVHRCIRDPSVREDITIPVDTIKSPSTRFIESRAEDINTDAREITLKDGATVGYDYLLVAIGSETAFFGIDGLRERAHTLKCLDDALAIHEDVKQAALAASKAEPAQIVVGGAGLSGIQTAGEIAEFRDDRDASLEIHLVEGMDRIFPGNDPEVQDALEKRLERLEVNILAGEFIDKVDEETVYVGEETELDYDVLIWTGGITGRDTVRNVDISKHNHNQRLYTEMDFQTEDERVFAIGDCALIDQPGDAAAPPTAEAAWGAADHVGENIARQLRDEPLETWTFESKGTAISIGDNAVAHDVNYWPVNTFGGLPARTFKKAIASRWIASVAGVSRAAKAWPSM